MAHEKDDVHTKELDTLRLAPNRGHLTLVAANIPAGYHGCFVNDEDNGQNIAAYKAAGYMFPKDVKINNKTVHESHSNIENEQKYVGQGVTAHLMVIPEHLAKKYIELPAKTSRDTTREISRGVPQNKSEDVTFTNKSR